MNIDWSLFKKQKEYLVAMSNDTDRSTSEIEVLDGVINLMDAVQDEWEPKPTRSEIELQVINYLLEVMESAEWVVTHVYDGGDKVETLTKDDVIATVFSVDDSTIGFCKEGVRKFVYIVLGNDGYDCIADHSTGGEFEELMDEVQKFCDTLAEQ